MTNGDAIDSTRARWAAPDLTVEQLRDIEERAALRLCDRGPVPLVMPQGPAARLFITTKYGPVQDGKRLRFRSAYVFGADEVDATIERLAGGR